MEVALHCRRHHYSVCGRVDMVGGSTFILFSSASTYVRFYLPRSAARTKGGIRGFKPWFDDRQILIAVTRVVRDDPAKRRYE